MAEREDKAGRRARDAARPPPRRQRSVTGRVVVTVLDAAVILAIAGFLGLLLLAGREIAVPRWLTGRIEDRLATAVAPGAAELGGIAILFDRIGPLEVRLHDLDLKAASGATLAAVPSVAITLDRSELWRGELRPSGLTLEGADLRLRRDAAGRLELGLGAGLGAGSLGSPTEALGAIDAAFDRPELAWIEEIAVRDLVVDYADDRAGRAWRVEDGALTITRDADTLSLAVSLEVPGTEAPDSAVPAVAGGRSEAGSETVPAEDTQVAFRLTVPRGQGGAGATLSALVKAVPAADIAAQSPVLTWLKPVDAPVSGALIGRLDGEGRLGPLDVTLEIGAGNLRLAQGKPPIPFDGARTYASWRPDTGRIRFDALDIRAPSLALSAEGHLLLDAGESGWPEAVTGQFLLDTVTVDAGARLPEPVRFDGGAFDVKLAAAPGVAEIGQLTLYRKRAEEGAPDFSLRLGGRIEAAEAGWRAAVDVSVPSATPEEVLSLWPMDAVPLTRVWLAENLLGGTLREARAAIRLEPGREPEISAGFEFENARVRALPSLPPVVDGAGYGSVVDDDFTLALDAGWMEAPQGGPVDLSDTVFRVLDLKEKPPDAEVRLNVGGALPAVLSVIDLPPFSFMQKAGRSPDVATGTVRAGGTLRFPLARRIRVDDVTFDIAATATGVASDTLVPGRRLEAARIDLTADRGRLVFGGDVTLAGVPIAAEWTQPLGAEAGPPVVRGTLPLSSEDAAALGIPLPEGMVRGRGEGTFALTLPREAPPEFTLESDLAGLALSVPPLGWSLPAERTGSLAVAGRLGAPPRIDRLRLEAPGLTAEGRMSFAAGGGLGEAVFSRVEAGRWLDAPVTLRGRGAGRAPAVSVTGGRADLRQMPSSGGGGGGGGTGGGPLSVALDRLTVSESIALTGLRGTFASSGGLTGDFTGRINGSAPVKGSLVRGRGGRSGLTLTAANAGAVFASAGLFDKGQGGSLWLSLTPRAEAGSYDGLMKISQVRVQGAPGLAALLNAISVVGLLDQLNGSGLLFTEIEAAFRLTPKAIEVTRSSGVGPSLGITMEGVYDMARDRVDMQGVFSPAYALNSIGQLFGARRAEGLVGLTYRMTGSAKAPQVQVNPLSALTPGMFRDIFRAPPPRLREP